MGVLSTGMSVHHMCAILLDARRKDTLDSEQVVVSLYVVLEIEPRFSARAASALNY